jgi:small subunit ribosomal protein S16
MLMLKLQRRGKKKQAAYRLIAGEKRTKLGGKQTDDLGWYDPHSSKHELNKDRINYWLKNGAKMTPTVNNLLVGAGIVEGKKIPKHKISNKPAAKPEESKA